MRSARTLAVALASAAAIALAGCGGGGGSAPATGTVPLAPRPPAGKATATITIRYTQNTHRLKRPKSGKRAPRFVDPYGSNITITSSDGLGAQLTFTTPVITSCCSDNSQTITAPVVSGTDVVISATESDPDAGPLAIGTTHVNNVSPGDSFAATLTLYMQVAGIAVTTDPMFGCDAVIVSPDELTPTNWSSYQVTNGSTYFVPFDPLYTFVTDLLLSTGTGVGGVPRPRIVSQSADNGGTSRVATDTLGAVHPFYDQAGNGINVHVTAFDINPLNVDGTPNAHFNKPLADGYVHFVPSNVSSCCCGVGS